MSATVRPVASFRPDVPKNAMVPPVLVTIPIAPLSCLHRQQSISFSQSGPVTTHLSKAFCTALTNNPTPALCIVTREAIDKDAWGWNMGSTSATDLTKKGEGVERAVIGGRSGLREVILTSVV